MQGRMINSPLRVQWGSDVLEATLAAELKRAGATNAVVVTGRTLGGDGQLVTRIEQAGQGLVGATVTDVREQSPLDAVLKVADALRTLGADGIIALGGGSSAVTARAAAILLAEDGDIADLATRYTDDGTVISPRLNRSKLPIIAVPTTPSTAFAKAGSAVTVAGHSGRFALYDPKTRARAVLIDDRLLSATPYALSASAGLNALVMAIEGLLSPASTVFSDAALAHATNLLTEALSAEGASNPRDLALASILVAQGTDTAGGGAVAAISHATGWRYGVANGIVDALILPHRLEFDARHRSGALARVEALLGGGRLVERLAILFETHGVPRRLRDIGVASDQLDEIARAASDDFAVRGNPSVTSSDIEEIVRRAW